MKLNDLKKQCAETKASVVKMEEEIEKLERGPTGRFIPKVNERYWVLGLQPFPIEIANAGSSLDQYRIETGNCYRSYEEAKAANQHLKAKTKLLDRIAELNDGWLPEFNAGTKVNFLLSFAHGKARAYCWSDHQSMPKAHHFKSKEIGEHLIEEFGDDFLKLALGVG